MIRSLVFDFDGLILETEEPIFRSWQELYKSFDQELLFERWATIIGTYETDYDPAKELEKLVGRTLDWEMLESKRVEREAELLDGQEVMPGVEQYLQDARRLDLKIGLASSSSCRWVVGHLTRLGLMEYFDCIRSKDDVQRTKPYPDLYLSALAQLGVRGDQAIALEDSPNGIRSAKAAGMFCVVVPNCLTHRLPLDGADLHMSSLADMPLEALLARFS